MHRRTTCTLREVLHAAIGMVRMHGAQIIVDDNQVLFILEFATMNPEGLDMLLEYERAVVEEARYFAFEVLDVHREAGETAICPPLELNIDHPWLVLVRRKKDSLEGILRWPEEGRCGGRVDLIRITLLLVILPVL